jgi:hypothetical protein
MITTRRASIRGLTAFLSLAAPWLVACGSSKTDSAASKLTSADAGGWETLITGNWTMPVGKEGYFCARKTVDEDIYVSGFEAINPKGTHHTLLTMGDPDAPDGITTCGAFDNRPLAVFASGVGTNPLEFPKGVALKIAKGTQLLLNLHLFNTGEADLTGLSGTRLHRLAAQDVTEVAEGLLAGTANIDLPPQETKTETGYCTMAADTTIFAVAPHMHKLGIHEKVVTLPTAGASTVLLDADYDFGEQSYRLINPVKLSKGDRVRIDCTYHNTTPNEVKFGESTLTEMCFAGIYRYPAIGAFFGCIDPPPDGGARPKSDSGL